LALTMARKVPSKKNRMGLKAVWQEEQLKRVEWPSEIWRLLIDLVQTKLDLLMVHLAGKAEPSTTISGWALSWYS